jgi:ferric-dicitrate binding protein FerR (iron transport regulator)
VAAAVGWLWLPNTDATDAACRVVETRGSVLLLPRDPGEEATPLAAGDVIATERRIWTCPWAAVALRLADGTRLQIDRASEATLACGRRPRVELIRGTAFVTRQRGAAGSAVLQTPQASIEVGHGLAAVVVDEDRTVIEVAEGETCLTAAGGPTTRIAAGQVAVLEKDGDGGVEVRQGRLEWQLPDESAGPGPAPADGS